MRIPGWMNHERPAKKEADMTSCCLFGRPRKYLEVLTTFNGDSTFWRSRGFQNGPGKILQEYVLEALQNSSFAKKGADITFGTRTNGRTVAATDFSAFLFGMTQIETGHNSTCCMTGQ